MIIERSGDNFSVDASLMAELLNVPPSRVQALMRRNEITSICERGEAEHAGQYRLTFFYRGRRARLTVDEAGRILRRSIVNYGERPLPRSLHGTGKP
ncbi:DUF6522 family protein [Manganibacter manganicus]|uniref:Uncharacterized protein n=1 Tax=Manganibacter manganicus TaxID=1873176 RepID=A0A1V8RLW7_9HYPH|nr:DUF6522 family protein [Pseudaminobacter manganicus]OQM74201.1 hypothetical protein BFN67_04940 [Pseudaminobacter manganicus]